MLWVALATALALLTGDGDDTQAFRTLLEHLRARVQAVIDDPERQRAALSAIEQAGAAFGDHRAGLAEVGQCIEALDRTYAVNAQSYYDCDAKADPLWHGVTVRMLEARRALRDAATPEQWAQIVADAAGEPR
jgi:hypothetical protein